MQFSQTNIGLLLSDVCICSARDKNSPPWGTPGTGTVVGTDNLLWGTGNPLVPPVIRALRIWTHGCKMDMNCHLAADLVRRYVVNHHCRDWCGSSISVCNQPPRSTQPGHPLVGRRNEYQPRGHDALRLGSKGWFVCGWQVKLCDPLVTHGPYMCSLEMRRDKALHKFTLLYFTLVIHIVKFIRTTRLFVTLHFPVIS